MVYKMIIPDRREQESRRDVASLSGGHCYLPAIFPWN